MWDSGVRQCFSPTQHLSKLKSEAVKVKAKVNLPYVVMHGDIFQAVSHTQ
jgi:hypothetical protein